MLKQNTRHIINERFYLKKSYCDQLEQKTPHFGFGGFSEATYYRTYSRIKEDGSQEHWADTVIRVINGIMSIRKQQMYQREWSDNIVSCTVYFDPKTEGEQIEYMLAQFAPIIKSVSLLPHSEAGAYKQMPYKGISKQEYEKRLKNILKIDWGSFGGSDGIESKFCS